MVLTAYAVYQTVQFKELKTRLTNVSPLSLPQRHLVSSSWPICSWLLDSFPLYEFIFAVGVASQAARKGCPGGINCIQWDTNSC